MVEYEPHGRVVVVRINRPDARNAVNAEVASGIEDAIDRLEADPQIWVGVLTGAGDVFCAGADLKAIAAGHASGLTTHRGGFAGIVARRRSKPLIAAVEGAALAGGCEIALACDLIVASRTAAFGQPEVRRSLVAAAGGLFRLPRALPEKVAMELLITGDSITAERAYGFGLVNELAEPGQAAAAALALAERICANAPVAVRESRAVALASRSADEEALWRMSFEAFNRVAQTEDFAEGPRAFVEKRPAAWKGR